jgi:hypothetical protein
VTRDRVNDGKNFLSVSSIAHRHEAMETLIDCHVDVRVDLGASLELADLVQACARCISRALKIQGFDFCETQGLIVDDTNETYLSEFISLRRSFFR